MITAEQPPYNPEESTSPQANSHLSLVEGGLGKEMCDISVTFVEEYESREGLKHRVETLTLESGRRYTCVVTEADPTAVDDSAEASLTMLVPGFTESPSSKKSTASNLHHEYSRRCRNVRTVSVDRLGLSEYSHADSPLDAIRLSLQSKEQAAGDLLDITAYYQKSKPVAFMGTSAGFDTILEMIRQNSLPGGPKQNIERDIYGIVPCLVAKEVPAEHASFRPDEPEIVTRAITIGKFATHCAVNFVESTVQNPLGTLDSRGILVTWAKNPLLPLMLPLHFAGHTNGTKFETIVGVAEKHRFIIVAGESDPLTAEKQYAAIEAIHEGSIDHRIIPGGHISIPINVHKALDALGIYDVARRESKQSNANMVESGLNLVTSSAEQAAGIAVKRVGNVGRLGGRVLTSLLHLEQPKQGELALAV